MPVYQYINSRGDIREEFRDIEDRDNAPEGFRRITVPARVGTLLGALNPLDSDQAVPNGLYRLECKNGTTDLIRKMGMPAKMIRKIWETPRS